MTAIEITSLVIGLGACVGLLLVVRRMDRASALLGYVDLPQLKGDASAYGMTAAEAAQWRALGFQRLDAAAAARAYFGHAAACVDSASLTGECATLSMGEIRRVCAGSLTVPWWTHTRALQPLEQAARRARELRARDEIRKIVIEEHTNGAGDGGAA